MCVCWGWSDSLFVKVMREEESEPRADESHIPRPPSLPEGRKFNWHGSKESKQTEPAGTTSRKSFYVSEDRCLRCHLQSKRRCWPVGWKDESFRLIWEVCHFTTNKFHIQDHKLYPSPGGRLLWKI